MKKYMIMLVGFMMTMTAGAQTQGDYNLLVHKKDGTMLTFPAEEVDSLTFVEEAPIQQGDNFKIAVSNITSTKADITITPQDPDMTYYHSIIDQTGYDSAYDTWGSIYELDKGWWKYVAQLYNKDWLEIMRSDLSKGKQEFESTVDISRLLWDETYYVYCYGINSEDGSVTTPLHFEKFKTAMPEESKNTFKVDILSNESDGTVKIKVTTTNNDQYYVGAQTKTFVDYYVESEGGVDEMFKTLIFKSPATSQHLHNGTKEVELFLQRRNTPYYLIICGYDGGPTTKIELIEFVTN